MARLPRPVFFFELGPNPPSPIFRCLTVPDADPICECDAPTRLTTVELRLSMKSLKLSAANAEELAQWSIYN